MRVGMVMTSLSRLGGGLTPAVCGLSTALNGTADCQVTAYGLIDRYTNDDKKVWGTLPTREFIAHGPRAWGYSPGLTKAVCNSGVDVLHRHGMWDFPSRSVWKAAKGQGTPYVVSTHGSLNRFAREIKPVRKWIMGLLWERKFLERANCLHALSSAEAAACREYGVTAPIAVIPNGIDPASPDPHLEAPWPNPHDGRKVLLFIGRLHPIKGLPTLLQALARVSTAARKLQWRLVIAGWEQLGHRGELESLSRELGISNEVDFVGGLFGEEKTNALYRANAFVLPSKSEGQPVAVLEAWSYKLPAVLTEACNLPVANERGFSLVNNGSVAAMADNLEQMFAMSETCRLDMGNQAQAYAQASYCWKSQAEKMLRVYHWLSSDDDCPYDLLYQGE